MFHNNNNNNNNNSNIEGTDKWPPHKLAVKN